MRNQEITSGAAAGLLWTVMFFGSMTGLSKAFVAEYERGTYLYLQISASSVAIYFGKLIFNFFMSLALNFFAVLLFFLFNDSIKLIRPSEFLLLILLGSLAIASATTIISAIIAKANSKNALFPVLSFPILLPLIILAIELTKHCLSQSANLNAGVFFQMIFAYSGMMIVGSYFLFDTVWKD